LAVRAGESHGHQRDGQVVRASGAFGSLLCFSILIATPVHGQRAVRIPSEASCASCTIQLQRTALLGSSDGDGILSDDATIRADGAGNFYISDAVAWPGELRVFSGDGHFRHSIGRRGRGPGEFQHPVNIVSVEAEMVAVMDAAAGRVTVLGPDRLEIHPLASPTATYAVLDAGVIVAAMHVRTPDRMAWSRTYRC
jgi:hypothetical protein